MGKSDLELEKEADALYKQGNDFIMEKKSDLAIPLLLKSKFLNLLLGFKGQSEKVAEKLEEAKKNVDRYNKGKRFSLTQAEKKKLEEETRSLFEYSKELEKRKKIDDSLLFYNDTCSFFDMLNLEYESKQAFWLLRRLEEEQKIAAGNEKNNDIWENFANQAINLGKKAVGKNEYNNAKEWYKEAIDILKDLKMFDVVGGLYKERENIENLKVEHLKNLRQKAKEQVLNEEQFQNRIESVISEKQKLLEKEKTQKKAITPEIQEKLIKIEMLIGKIEKEKLLKKYQRAIGRYQVIISIYDSIPNDFIDKQSKISEIKKFITELENLTP